MAAIKFSHGTATGGLDGNGLSTTAVAPPLSVLTRVSR